MFFDESGKSSTLFNVAVGTGLILAAPVVLPIVSGVARPLVKGLIRFGITVYESGREQAAELSEYAEDLVAEVRSEIEQERAARAAQAETPASAPPGPVAAQ